MASTGGVEFDEPDKDKVKSYLVVVIGGIYKDNDRKDEYHKVGDNSIKLVSFYSLDQWPDFARLASAHHLNWCSLLLFFQEIMPLLVLDLLDDSGRISIKWRISSNLHEENLLI